METITTGAGIILMGEAAKSFVLLEWVSFCMGWGLFSLFILFCVVTIIRIHLIEREEK